MTLNRRYARSFGQERGTRRPLLAAGAGSGGALLAACGAAQGGASTGGAAEPAKTRPAVTLEYWSRWGLPTAHVENKRVAEWNTANGPTKVECTSIEP